MDTLTFRVTDPGAKTLTANLSRVFPPSGGTETNIWKIGGFAGIRKVLGNERLERASFLLWLTGDDNTLIVREFMKWKRSHGALGAVEFSQASQKQDGTPGEPLTQVDIGWDGLGLNLERVEEVVAQRGPWKRQFIAEFVLCESEDSD